MSEALDKVAACLSRRRFVCVDEAELQRAVAVALEEDGIGFKREKRIGTRDRLDFFIDGGVVLELKVSTTQKNVYRQILRYAEHGFVKGVLVASTHHLALRLPETANGKPLRTLQLRSL